MIIDLPDTTVSAISKKLVSVREEGGAVALGRVLTLIIVTRHGAEEEVIEAANDASREHPMRVIAVLFGDEGEEPRLDAQIRVGGDAGASEVVVLRCPRGGGVQRREPRDRSPAARRPRRGLVARRGAGGSRALRDRRIAQRRITDASSQADPTSWVAHLGEHYAPGRHRLRVDPRHPWREQLAAVLDQPPYEP